MTDHVAASVFVERLHTATPAEVYDEWLDPEALMEWMCPRPARCLRVESEPRVGGRLRIDIEEAGTQFYVHGTYTELDRPRRLGFTWSCSTWPDPTVITYVMVTLTAQGLDQTLMTISHTALAPDLADNHRRGWELIAVQLDAELDRDEGTPRPIPDASPAERRAGP
jgi:uncharacterized protein YndB with AHSA1/START domain